MYEYKLLDYSYSNWFNSLIAFKIDKTIKLLKISKKNWVYDSKVEGLSGA